MTKSTAAAAIVADREKAPSAPANAGRRAYSTNHDGDDFGTALPIVRDLPLGCLRFTIGNREAEPILHMGDVVAVDVMDLSPEEDAFYLRRCNSVHRQDNLTVLALRLLKMKGSPQGTWWLGPRRKPGRPDWCDGPYSEQRLREALIGRVVAIIDDRAPEAMDVDHQFPVRSQCVVIPQ